MVLRAGSLAGPTGHNGGFHLCHAERPLRLLGSMCVLLLFHGYGSRAQFDVHLSHPYLEVDQMKHPYEAPTHIASAVAALFDGHSGPYAADWLNTRLYELFSEAINEEMFDEPAEDGACEVEGGSCSWIPY